MSSTTPTREPGDSEDPIRVLFVETDGSSNDDARAVFEDEFGIDVTVASGTADVLELLDAVDCVVDEVHTPGGAGLDRLRTVREADSKLPYIVYSESRTEDVIDEALSAGATDYLRTDRTDAGYRLLASSVALSVGDEGGSAGDRSPRPLVDVTDGTCLLDESLTFVAVGERYAALHGYDREELVGKPWRVVFPDDETERIETAGRRAASRGWATEESPALRRDGHTFAAVVVLGEGVADRYVCSVFDLDGRTISTGGSAARDEPDLERRFAGLEALVTIGADEPSVSAQAVCDALVGTIGNENELAAVSVYLYDEAADTLRRRAATPRLADAASTLPFDDPSAPVWHAFLDREPVFVADLVPQATVVNEPEQAGGVVVPVGAHGVLLVGAPATNRFPPFDRALVRLAGAIAGTVLDRVDANRRQRTCERRLEEATATTDRFAESLDLVCGVGRVLTTAWTRDELEKRLCERIVSNERYAFARIAEYDEIGASIRERASAGSEKRYLESLETDVDVLVSEGEPMAVAIRTHEPRLARRLVAAGGNERWRQDAIARGVRSVVGVPLEFKERSYGGLAVYSTHPDGFDETERAIFEDLGAWVGHAIHAIETKAALVDRSGVELEFRVRDREIQFLEWARETESTVEFETVVSRPDGLIRGFFTIDGARADVILELARRSPAVTETRLVTERGEKHLFECTLTEDSIVAQLLEYGAVPKTITASEAAGRLVVILPEHTDVREFVEIFTRLYPDSTLVRRQNREYVVQTEYGFLGELEGKLTAKQFEALETAFASGYFEIPRETTGAEVASILEITQPTFNRHLRVAQRELLSMLFRDGSATD
ncbi:bacterio-opsin activator domain-containing protein [Natrialbaceae archaeon A-arb3/5]